MLAGRFEDCLQLFAETITPISAWNDNGGIHDLVDLRARPEEEHHSLDMVTTMLAQCSTCSLNLASWAFAIDVHERMGSTDFSPINSAIAGSFEDGEVLGVVGIEDEAIDRLLDRNE